MDAIDLLLVTRMALGQYQPADPQERIRADVVPDPLYLAGLINVSDLVVLRHIALQAAP